MRRHVHLAVNASAGALIALHDPTPTGLLTGLFCACVYDSPNMAEQRRMRRSDGDHFDYHPKWGYPIIDSPVGYRTISHWWVLYAAVACLTWQSQGGLAAILLGASIGSLLHILVDLFRIPGVPILTPYGARVAIPVMWKIEQQRIVTSAVILAGGGMAYFVADAPKLAQLGASIIGIPFAVAADIRWLASLAFGTAS